MATSILKTIHDTGWVIEGEIRVRRIGNIVFLQANSLNATHNVSIATLSSQYRPAIRCTAPAAFPLNTNIYINIETNGNVTPIQRGGGDIENLFFSASYPAAN